MGFIWRLRSSADHGIDGDIELVDRIDRNALNQLILVQSKASSAPFPGEDDSSFHFDFKAADVEYWQGSNVPVIVICSHPGTQEAWWAPERRAQRANGRSTFRITFDKARDRFDRNAAAALLALARTGTIQSSQPTAKRESLTSNLITVLSLPDTIWAAPTWLRKPADVVAHLRSAGCYRRGWVFHQGTIFGFGEAPDGPLQAVIDGPTDVLDAVEWSASKDLDVQRRFVRLLNGTVTDMTSGHLRRHKRGYLYFRPTPDLDRLVISTGQFRRTVFQPYTAKSDPDRILYYRHFGLWLSFVAFDGVFYAELEPTYHYTFDGFRDVPWSGELLKKIKARERNQAVRLLVEFWARHLQAETLFRVPGPITFGELTKFEVERGIHEPAWKVDSRAPRRSRKGTPDSPGDPAQGLLL
jgi:hypothetical protein